MAAGAHTACFTVQFWEKIKELVLKIIIHNQKDNSSPSARLALTPSAANCLNQLR
jgi:hypothetical protein